jgi:hypothetical protein
LAGEDNLTPLLNFFFRIYAKNFHLFRLIIEQKSTLNDLRYMMRRRSFQIPKRIIQPRKRRKFMSDYVVRIEGLKLSKDVQASINREIQATVLRELAKVDLKGDFSARIPRGELQGIYIRDKAFETNFALQVNVVK